jgi:hypothetical protein
MTGTVTGSSRRGVFAPTPDPRPSPLALVNRYNPQAESAVSHRKQRTDASVNRYTLGRFAYEN